MNNWKIASLDPESRQRYLAATNGMAVAGFVLALSAWLLAWTLFMGFICWVLGCVFSAIGLHRHMNEGRGRKGLAIAGMCLSFGGIAIAIVIFGLMAL